MSQILSSSSSMLGDRYNLCCISIQFPLYGSMINRFFKSSLIVIDFVNILDEVKDFMDMDPMTLFFESCIRVIFDHLCRAFLCVYISIISDEQIQIDSHNKSVYSLHSERVTRFISSLLVLHVVWLALLTQFSTY